MRARVLTGRLRMLGILGALVAAMVCLPAVAHATGRDGFEPDNVRSQARLLRVDAAPQPRTLAPEGDGDWARMRVEAGKAYVVRTQPPDPRRELDTVLEVYDASGRLIARNDDDFGHWGVSSRVVITPDEDQTLFIKVRGYWEGLVGAYELCATSGRLGGIAGRVTDERGSVPLSGIQVRIYSEVGESGYGWYEWVADAETDDNGVYEARGLEPGQYYVGFHDPSGEYAEEFHLDAACLEAADAVDVAAGDTVAVDARLGRAATVRGTITDDDSGDPVVGAAAVAFTETGASAYGWSGYDVTAWAEADEHGEYELAGLPPNLDTALLYLDGMSDGLYVPELYDDVPVDPWGFDPSSGDQIVLSPAEERTIDVGLARARDVAGIAGVVTDEVTHEPLADIAVSVRPAAAESAYGWSGYGWTDRRGRFRVVAPANEPVIVRFRDYRGRYLTEYYDNKRDASEADRLTLPGGTISEIFARLDEDPGKGRIAGRVIDEKTGEPIEHAWVFVFADSSYAESGYGWSGYEPIAEEMANEDGEYAVAGLDPATPYRLLFHDPRGEHAEEYFDDCAWVEDAADVFVHPGGVTPVIGRMERWADLTGTVLEDGSGLPLQDIAAELFIRLPESGYGSSGYAWGACEESGYGDSGYGWSGYGGGWWGFPGFERAGGADTDGRGHWAIGELNPNAEYMLLLRDPRGAYVAEFFDDGRHFREAKLIRPDVTRVAVASLAPVADRGRVAGAVTDDWTGAPVADVLVELFACDPLSGYSLADVVLSRPDGAYDFRGVAPGLYKIGFQDEERRYADEFWQDALDLSSAGLCLVTGDGVWTADASLLPLRSDVVAPEIEIDGLAKGESTYYNALDLGVSATDDDSGLEELTYRLDGEATRTVDGEGTIVSVTAPFDGRLTVTARDRAGNRSTRSERFAVVADVDGPAIRLDGVKDGGTYFGSVRIDVSATDEVSGIGELTYRLGKGPVRTVTGGSATIEVPAPFWGELKVGATDRAGNPSERTIRFSVLEPAAGYTPVQGANRTETALAAAEAAFPGWEGVGHVIVASGAGRSASDPLAASGLCWAYDAPLILIRDTGVPGEVAAALREIKRVNGTVDLHVVGGPAAVPKARLDELRAITGPGSVDRVWGADRFQTAKAILDRMIAVAAEDGRVLPDYALIANGINPASFFDALALSPISANNGAPILLVRRDDVPPATRAGVRGFAKRYVAGGKAVVSAGVVRELSAERWAGADRFATAAKIAAKAIANGYATSESVGIAAALPDALAGGCLVGRQDGVLLLTRRDALSPPTARFLDDRSAQIRACYIFGGGSAVSRSVRNRVNQLLE